MIAIVALGLALLSSSEGANHHRQVEPGAVCRLIRKDSFAPGQLYSISGIYFADGTHGSSLEIPGCDQSINPIIVDDAADKIAAYHDAFANKCGAHLRGDYISGVFTGKFIRRKARLYGMQSARMLEFFVSSNIETDGLDVALISCAK